MANKDKKVKTTSSNSKIQFSKGSKKKRTSIGDSKNSRPKNKQAVRLKKGR
jgi:hypothetical protein